MDPTPLGRLLRRQDGIVSRWQALRQLIVKTVEHKVTSGRWRRVGRGVFVTHPGPLTPGQRAGFAVLASGGDRNPSVCLAGLSALRAWGLRSIDPDGVHVLVPSQHRVRRRAGVHVHRSGVPPGLIEHMRPPATLPGRSVVDAARWARTEREAQLIVAVSFQHSLVTLADVERAAAAQLPTARRRALVLATAADCAEGCHSTAELDFMALCRRFRLPMPARQVSRLDRHVRRRFVDAVFDPWHIAVEIDGAHHLEVALMWDDAIKSNALELDGYVELRYPAHALRTQAHLIAAQIKEALRTAGWTR